MPSRKNAEGLYRDIAHPITASFRATLEEAILEAYYAAKDEQNNEEAE